MAGTATVAVFATAFVAAHFVLSHPLRRPLAGAMGEGAFAAFYSLVAAGLMGGIVWAYRTAPPTAPLWAVGDALWLLATVLMLGASVLLAGSLVGNPAMPGPSPVPPAARGVFAITRHPMMWSFATWGVCHVLVFPIAKNVVVAVAMTVLALAGAALQDRKKALLRPDAWAAWEARTGFLPFAAIAAGRAQPTGPGAPALLGGTALWLAATWAHGPLAGWPAGIWRWM